MGMQRIGQQLWNRIRQVVSLGQWTKVRAVVAIMIVLFGAIVPVSYYVNQAFAAQRGPSAIAHPHANQYRGGNSQAPRQFPPNPHPVNANSHLKALGAPTRHTTLHLPSFILSLTHVVGSGEFAYAMPQSVKGMSADGHLEVQVPLGALTSADLAHIGGAPQLVVTEVDPPSGSTNGGIISFGTYLFQLQDGSGHEIANGMGLRQPLLITYHWANTFAPVPLAFQQVVFIANGALPATLPMMVKHLGKLAQFKTNYDPQTKTLSVPLPMSASSSGGSFVTNSPESYFGKPAMFQDNTQTADLAQTIPIDVPAGPGGLTPSLALAYNSGGVDASHNVQAAAPWVGQGWNLDMGAITWSESYDPAAATNTTPASNQWRSTWSLSDPFGTNGDLLPPTWGASTFYNDTSFPVSTAPLTWHSAPETRAKIISFTNPAAVGSSSPFASYFPAWNGSTGYSVMPPCFRVWLPNGIMEEFGCTLDSLQFYPSGSSGTTNYITAWKLDMITDPSGNQIHLTYDWDKVQAPSGNWYPRDSVLHSVTWDSPNCHNANIACSTWNPLMQVAFTHGNQSSHPVNGDASQVCGPIAGTTLRCDDPAPKQSGIDIGTPLLTQTQILNDLQVQVRSSSTDSWHLLRDYQFTYKQGWLNPNRVADPFIDNTTISTAGYLLLEQVLEMGTDGTAYPPQNFRYIPFTQYYEDSYYPAAAGAGCGPNWNTSCKLWDRNYNAFYITEADNGMGLQQTFAWDNYRTNQHGVNSGDATDPLNCTKYQNANGSATQYPCNLPDDNGWSHIGITSRTVTDETPNVNGANSPPQQTTGTWYYDAYLSQLTAHECSDCTVGMYWGNANSADKSDFYNGRFMGFTFAQAERPDGVTTDSTYYGTEGWGVWGSSVPCQSSPGLACQLAPFWDLTNAASGKSTQVDLVLPYDAPHAAFPIMQRTNTNYTAICPGSGVAGTPAINSVYTWAGKLVAQQDADNPVASCDVRATSSSTYLANGVENAPSYGAIANVPTTTVAYSYDQNEASPQYSHLTATTTTGNDLSATPTIVQYTSYVWDDAVQTSSLPPTGTYIVDKVNFADVEDGAQHQQQCTYSQYDGMSAPASGQQSGLTRGLPTQVNRYTACPQSGTTISTTAAYDAYGNPLNGKDADAVAGIAGHIAPVGSLCTGATACTTYDGTFFALPAQAGDAIGHITGTTTYVATQQFGFGLWPQQTTDLNGQVTSYTYDGLGRPISMTAPLESSGVTTASSVYTNSCPTTGPNQPCLVVDATQRLDSTHQITAHSFADGWGHAVETRKPGPVGSGQDVVQYSVFDNQGRNTFSSVPYFVTSGSGYSIPDYSQPGASTIYDALGRVTSVTDANSVTSTVSYAARTNVAGTDNAPYVATTAIDGDGHQHVSYTDAVGRTVYTQDFTGTAGSYALYRTQQTVFNYLGQPTQTIYADGTHSAHVTYDALGRQTDVTDPDLGTMHYTYDPNGNETSSQDARGTTGTTYMGYDGLNRTTWLATNSTGSNPLASYTYDSGTNGLGQLAQESFASGPNQSVTGNYAYQYDARGRVTSKTMTIAGTGKLFQMVYNDANQQTQLTHSDGTTLTTSYDANDWYNGSNAGTTTILTNVYFANLAGAAGKITNAGLGNGTALTNWYDYNLHQTKALLAKNGATIFAEDRAFDNVGNVVTKATTVPQGMVNQTFCYDEQNRITWAGSSGTPACGTPLSSGTFTQAQYSQTYTYDTLDRMTSGLEGSASFGDGSSQPLHALTSGTRGYSALYDAAGQMTCRAPTSSQICSPTTQTGQTLSYDALNRLLSWQNQPSSPTSTAQFAYDGEGERVWQQTTVNGTTTTTTYFGGLEESATTGGTTTTTHYYATGAVTLENKVGVWTYLLNDGLGSVSLAMSTTGSITADALFKPFGVNLYHNSTMPTALGFTGQYSDATSGLDYYGARYYDPNVGQFISADTVQGPNRYGYVGWNPETFTDPTGHDACGGNWFCQGLDFALSLSPMQQESHDMTDPNLNFWQHSLAGLEFSGNFFLDVTMIGEIGRPLVAGIRGGIELIGEMGARDVAKQVAAKAVTHVVSAPEALANAAKTVADVAKGVISDLAKACANSFAADTPVATPGGAVAIAALAVGDKVMAFDPATGKATPEKIEKVFVNHDDNLLDVTLHAEQASKQLSLAKLGKTSITTETLHTTTEHPFLTTDRGFVDANQLQVGEKVQRLDGSVGVVVAIKATPGSGVRYNLTVAHEHTYAVGIDRWIVHNCGGLITSITNNTFGKTITSGVQRAVGTPFFKSTLSKDSTAFYLQIADRQGLQEHASTVFAQQFASVGGDPAVLQQIILQQVENKPTISAWYRTGSLIGSPLDNMAQNFAREIGVQISGPSGFVGKGSDMIYNVLP